MPKKVTWNDIGNEDTIVKRPFKVIKRVSLPGTTYVILECPFCLTNVKVYVWSIRGGGKRCQCGAMHSGLGNTYQFKENVKDEK